MLQNINEVIITLKDYDIGVVEIDSKTNKICIVIDNGQVHEYNISPIINKIKLMLEINENNIFCILN